MSWLSKMFFPSKSQLSIKFSKTDNAWVVTKDYSILFIGNQAQCNVFVKNFS